MSEEHPDWIIESAIVAADGKSMELKCHERMNPLHTMNITNPSDTFVRAWFLAERLYRFERALEEAHDILTGRKL